MGLKPESFIFDRQPAPVIVVEAKSDTYRNQLRDDPAFEEQLRAILVSTGWPQNWKFLFEVKGTT